MKIQSGALNHLDDLFRAARALLPNDRLTEEAVMAAYIQTRTGGTPSEVRTRLFTQLLVQVQNRRGPFGFTSPGSDPALRLLRELPFQQAAALLLTEVFGFAFAEVAEILRASQEEVRSGLSEGRRSLMASFGSGSAVSVAQGARL